MQDPYKLAEKYFRGLCSKEEAEAFLDWYFSEQGEEEIKRKIDLSHPSIKKKHTKYWDSRAVFKKIQSAKNTSSLFISHKQAGDTEQASKASGTKNVKVISARSQRWLYGVASAIILIAVSLGIWTYQTASTGATSQESSSLKYVNKSNPSGQKSTIFLKDGSQIVLNSASSIRYPAKFPSDERVIELTGEAFFEVARDSLRPFRVVVDNAVITALGTSFNVRSYEEEENLTVGLITGSVEVKGQTATSKQSIYLVPGEGVTYSARKQQMTKIQVDPEKFTAWKNGILYFEDEPIEELVKTLERWYGVEFIIENEITGIFTGKFKNQSLEAVLKGISYSYSLNYDINGKYVRLTSKNNKK